MGSSMHCKTPEWYSCLVGSVAASYNGQFKFFWKLLTFLLTIHCISLMDTCNWQGEVRKLRILAECISAPNKIGVLFPMRKGKCLLETSDSLYHMGLLHISFFLTSFYVFGISLYMTLFHWTYPSQKAASRHRWLCWAYSYCSVHANWVIELERLLNHYTDGRAGENMSSSFWRLGGQGQNKHSP